ncbi:MAG: HNH endonuclease, partial [Oligoflexia bacterium]|nr:HNH endonuclease [Oligoflexia bacterium]
MIKDIAKRNAILRQTKTSLSDASHVNILRKVLPTTISSTLALPVTTYSVGRTKFNREKQGYRKDHWIDAACVGVNGENV